MSNLETVPLDKTPPPILKAIDGINLALTDVNLGDAFSALLTLTMHAIDVADEEDKTGMMEAVMEAVDLSMKNNSLKSQIIIPKGMQ